MFDNPASVKDAVDDRKYGEASEERERSYAQEKTGQDFMYRSERVVDVEGKDPSLARHVSWCTVNKSPTW